jgi:hypothetical protein
MESLRGDPNLVEGLLSSRSSGGSALLANITDDVHRDVCTAAVPGVDRGDPMAELEKEAAGLITPHAATIENSMKELLRIIADMRAPF